MARNRLLWMRDHLPLRVRLRSYPYLLKETLWNILNVCGVSFGKQHISRQHSHVMLIALWDFLLRRFGRWPRSIDRIIQASENEKRLSPPPKPSRSSKLPAADL